LEQFKELLATSRVRILQPEPLHLGGLHIAHRLDDLAQSNGAVICPHSAQGPVCSAACAHLNTASGAFFLHEMFDDFNVEDHPWEADVLTGAIQVKNGVIEASDRPGLGVDLNLDVVRAHPYEVQNFIPLFHTGWEKRKGFR
jgi:galactonate dehydratase